ncbi:Hsp20/alpha crystallin family protein [Cupriavidus plantarum]|uniref:Hsp20/alpha crystallin family protein n=1 Tax=Cupriavidus plantarum TaxID=942865 RepID=UPI00339D3293
MTDAFFGTDLFSDLDRLQKQMTSLLGGFPSSIRAGRFGAFPAINTGATDDSIEIVAFAPGVKPEKLEVTIDRGLLTISGERPGLDLADTPDARRYAQERFAGAFRRVIELPEGADPDKVRASYTNGCLSVSVGKRETSKPRAVTVQ